MVAPQVIRRPYTATLITAKGVIPAKAGIQKNTGFPRIKYGAGLVKPGMTNKEKEQSLCVTRSTAAQGMLPGKHNSV